MQLIETYPASPDFHLFEDVASRLPMGGHSSPGGRGDKPIIPEKTPNKVADSFLKSCHILMHENRPAGRFALYENPAMTYENEKAVCIGNYESMNDDDCSSYILGKATEMARKYGARWLIGPMNGSTLESYRFSDYSSKDDFFLEPENPAWYNGQFLHNGFTKIASYVSTYDTEMTYDFAALQTRKEELLNEGYVTRPIRLDNYEEELGKIYDLSISAFKGNFLFTPIERDSFVQKYLPLKPLIDSNFVLMAEDGKGELAGFVFGIDDLKNKSRKRLILKSMARRPGRQDRGLGDILGCEIGKRAKGSGYEGVIHALMHAHGSSLNLSKNRKASVIKTYSLYAIPLR